MSLVFLGLLRMLCQLSFVKLLRLVNGFVKHHTFAIYGLVLSVNGFVKYPKSTIMVCVILDHEYLNLSLSFVIPTLLSRVSFKKGIFRTY